MNFYKLTIAGRWRLCSLLAMMVLCGCASTESPETFSRPSASEVLDLNEPAVTTEVAAGPDARAVMAALDRVELAIEKQDLAGILQQISVYYGDENNNSYPKLRLFFQDTFEDYANIDIRRSETTVTVDDSMAEVSEQFATKATPRQGSSAPVIDETGTVTVRLRRVAGEWLVTEWVKDREQ